MDHLFPKGCQDFVRKDVGFRVDHIWTDFDVRETFSTSGEIIFHPILNQIQMLVVALSHWDSADIAGTLLQEVLIRHFLRKLQKMNIIPWKKRVKDTQK